MKFLFKILLWNVIILTIVFCIGGYSFIQFVFNTSMQREIEQAMDENSILQFAFETAALNIPSRYDVLQDSMIEEIGHNLEKGGQRKGGRLLRLSNENRVPVYTSEGFVESDAFLREIKDDVRIYQLIKEDESYYVQIGVKLETLDRILYLETMKDITQVYEERKEGFLVYRQGILIALFSATLIMFLIGTWLTHPIRLLTKATKKMTEGSYDYRAKVVSDDELGQLTNDFNRMANVLEENIHKLKLEIETREEFIAAFSHELKTPLTAIIGYADMLRSRKLDEEKQFLSANYIFTEGKRLETMAFRLLDIIVTKRNEIEKQSINTEVIFKYLKTVYADYTQVNIIFQYEKVNITVENDLLKSVLINLIDNACKASEDGGKVEILGRKTQDGYLFAIKDYGEGIPKDECSKITDAFYMVDKSRSRSRNGAGLGLALCTEILKLHNCSLKIESQLGVGSCFSFVIPWEEVEKVEEPLKE